MVACIMDVLFRKIMCYEEFLGHFGIFYLINCERKEISFFTSGLFLAKTCAELSKR